MSSSHENLMKAIKHCQDSLDKYTETQNAPKVLHYIEKLRKLPIQMSHLEQTGIGRTVNGLRKFGGPVSDAAKSLVARWKEMVVEAQVEEQEDEDDDDDDDVDDGYSEELLGPSDSPNNDSDHNDDSESDDSDQDTRSIEQKRKPKEHSSHRQSDKDRTENRTKPHKYDAPKTEDDSTKDSKKHKHKHHKHNGHSSSTSKHVSSHSKRKRSSDVSDSEDESRFEKRLKKDENSESETRNKNYRDESRERKKFQKQVESDDEVKKDKKKMKSKSDSDNEPRETKKKHKSDGKSRRESDAKSSYRKDKHKVEEVKKHEHKKVKEDERKDKRKDVKTKEESRKASKSDKKSFKSKNEPINGIDSGSGASFAEALGMCEPSSSKSSTKKKFTVLPEKITKEKTVKCDDPMPKLPKELPVDSEVGAPQLWPLISPNYRPMGNSLIPDSPPKKVLSDYEQLSNIISSKNQRTKVYSGNKTGGGKVPGLFETCIRILQDNIDALEYTGGVPYAILKPVLDKATPNQLFMLEHHNPYLIEDTDELWKIHCQKEFRNKKCQELESWREMYMRCLDEREAKLKALTANIKQAQDKSLPVRTTKLAYVDDIAKPPRNIARKQAKNGTGCDKKPTMTPTARLNSLATAGEAGKVSVPNPGARAAERSSHHATVKPKKAPLMAKTLSLLKSRFFKR